MSVAIVTGACGLVGSEASRFFHAQGMEVIGIDNNMRRYFFGDDGSVEWNGNKLRSELKNFRLVSCDIRSEKDIEKIFREIGKSVSLVLHCAAQPSHDWAAKEPMTDFSVNATGTLVMLEATRKYSPDATFIFTSTNKVYGDAPNRLPLVEEVTRWECDPGHVYATHGIDESMSIDQCLHSIFGASKVAADVLVQEYGRYFGTKTGVFRGGCLTGPAHSGAELHGFLAYVVKCGVTGRPYKVFGYKGKQVRDNIHSNDLVEAFWSFHRRPRPGAVYNMGGGRENSCSVLEAIKTTEELTGRPFRYEVVDGARSGDHIWWISDLRKFRTDYPDWKQKYTLRQTIQEIIEATKSRPA